jgi:hypothetical protein
MFRTLAALTTALLTATSTTAFAQSDIADFYRGKTVRLVIGYGAAAATTSMPNCWRASSASTFPANRP